MARITRKELRTDKFALEVGQTVNFFEEHRGAVLRYGAIALGVLALIAIYTVYARHQRNQRQDALYQAIQIQDTPVGAPSISGLTFQTEEARNQAAIKAFGDIATKYSGSDQADIASYYLGAVKAEQGNIAEAEKQLLAASEGADEKYSSLAKLSLAQIYFADGRADQGEKLLRQLMDKPTVFVSKEQATISLARHLMSTKPAEARKLLQPLLTKPGGVGQVAIALSAEIPQ